MYYADVLHCVNIHVHLYRCIFSAETMSRHVATGERLKPSAAIVPLRAHPTLQGAITCHFNGASRCGGPKAYQNRIESTLWL